MPDRTEPIDRAIAIRPGRTADQPVLDALIARERVKPIGNRAENFLLAIEDGAVVGAAQLRRHRDGARELATLVVGREHRGRGIAGALIEALLQHHSGPVFMITGQRFAGHYGGRGFRRISRGEAPRSIRFNHAVGQLAGIISLLRGLRPQRLAILARGTGLVREAA